MKLINKIKKLFKRKYYLEEINSKLESIKEIQSALTKLYQDIMYEVLEVKSQKSKKTKKEKY